MALRIKPGVKLAGLRPEIWVAVDVAKLLFDSYGIDCVVTEALPTANSKHGRNSLHNVGLAVDLRSQELRSPELFAATLREALGESDGHSGEYDVVVEPSHLHIEFLPS